MIKKWNPRQLCLAILPSALAVGSTLVSASPSLALNYRWDVNLSDNGYSATGYVVTDTSTPNTALAASNIVDWNFALTNGSTTDTLALSNSTLSYGNGLKINGAGNALVLPQDGAFASITFQNPSSNIYFGYPLTSGSTPYLRIVINNGTNVNGNDNGFGLGRLYGSTTYATGSTAVPWELSPNMLTVIGVPFFFGLQRLKKKVASSTLIKISETVS